MFKSGRWLLQSDTRWDSVEEEERERVQNKNKAERENGSVFKHCKICFKVWV